MRSLWLWAGLWCCGCLCAFSHVAGADDCGVQDWKVRGPAPRSMCSLLVWRMCHILLGGLLAELHHCSRPAVFHRLLLLCCLLLESTIHAHSRESSGSARSDHGQRAVWKARESKVKVTFEVGGC